MELDYGRSFFTKLASITEPDASGGRVVTFEVNGERWFIKVTDDKALEGEIATHEQAQTRAHTKDTPTLPSMTTPTHPHTDTPTHQRLSKAPTRVAGAPRHLLLTLATWARQCPVSWSTSEPLLAIKSRRVTCSSHFRR